MNADVLAHLQWRLSVLRDRLDQRLASPHAIVREHALEHQAVARMLESLRDTPEAAYTGAQAIWAAWLIEAARLYREIDWRANYDEYRALCEANSLRRDEALMALEARAA